MKSMTLTNNDAHVLVDACIARSVGAKRDTMPARDIRVVLDEIQNGPVGLLMTPLLRQEWERHASPVMKRWLARMVSRRRVKTMRDRRVNDLRSAAARSAITDAEIVAIEKDAHITEAAILSKSGVISLDDAQLRLLARVATLYPLVGHVQWFHPVRDCVDCATWVASGCADSSLSRVSASAA